MDNDICTGHEDIDDNINFETLDTKVCVSFDTFPIFKDTANDAYYRQ
jgi:hypothetical protein